MAVGQGALVPSARGTLDVAALDAAELRLEVRAARRCHEHGQLLREVLALHGVLEAAGAGLSTVPQLGLLLQLSESAGAALLAEAQLLTSLPGGLEALDCGLLTVAQSAALLRAVGHLDDEVRLAVWSRLRARLLAAFDAGAVLTPARLASSLAAWILAADPRSAEQRRKAAEAAGDVTYRRRDDGVGDLLATGIPAPLLQAVLCRLRDASRPFGTHDERSAGKRRLDALTDLLLGRRALSCEEATASDGRTSRPTCGCPLHSPVPCGADVVVHVPLGAALGTTDELAELVGHGPLHPDQLQQLLLSAPRLRAVHVDAQGVPVSADERVHRPRRGDPHALREALLELSSAPPGLTHPRHPFDHPPSVTPAHDRAGATIRHEAPPGQAQPRQALALPHAPAHEHGRAGATARQDAPARTSTTLETGGAVSPAGRPQVRSGGHPVESAGPYRLPRRLRRLAQFRSPRCEWPACGVGAAACDLDHDLPWPAGPTCACNVGPLCRRHHRVKQATMQKVRGEKSQVVWTDPTGRRWTSLAQHEPPALPARALGEHVDRTGADVLDLPPWALVELLAPVDDDPVRLELRVPDSDPDEPHEDRLAERLAADDGWGLVLDDPYRWVA